jgi:hypothetical protein
MNSFIASGSRNSLGIGIASAIVSVSAVRKSGLQTNKRLKGRDPPKTKLITYPEIGRRSITGSALR